MRHTSRLLLLPLLASSLLAQTVSITLTAATPLTARASAGGQFVSNTLPVGPIAMPVQLNAVAGPGGGEARMHNQFSASVRSSAADCFWFQTATVDGTVGDFADMGPADVVWIITASAPATVDVTLRRDFLGTAGAVVPAHRMDFGDDGLFEFTELSAPTQLFAAVQVGTTPLRIRMRSHLQQDGPGLALLSMAIEVAPANAVYVRQNLIGCSNDPLILRPTFVGRGIEIEVISGFHPEFAVFGFGLQPQLLGSVPLPCWLLPQADVVLLLPPSVPFTVPLPSAIRPLTFYVQSVGATAQGLTTSSGYQVTAH